MLRLKPGTMLIFAELRKKSYFNMQVQVFLLLRWGTPSMATFESINIFLRSWHRIPQYYLTHKLHFFYFIVAAAYA